MIMHVLVKTLMWIQKTSAGGDEKLILKFMNSNYYAN